MKVSLNNREFSTPVNLENGIYIIQLGSGKQIALYSKAHNSQINTPSFKILILLYYC